MSSISGRLTIDLGTEQRDLRERLSELYRAGRRYQNVTRRDLRPLWRACLGSDGQIALPSALPHLDALDVLALRTNRRYRGLPALADYLAALDKAALEFGLAAPMPPKPTKDTPTPASWALAIIHADVIRSENEDPHDPDAVLDEVSVFKVTTRSGDYDSLLDQEAAELAALRAWQNERRKAQGMRVEDRNRQQRRDRNDDLDLLFNHLYKREPIPDKADREALRRLATAIGVRFPAQ